LLELHILYYNTFMSMKEEKLNELNILTLSQASYCKMHRKKEMLEIEDKIKACTYDIFDENADGYYSIHLFDMCQFLVLNDDLSTASSFLNMGRDTMLARYGDCQFLSFISAYLNACIDYKLEEYYMSLENCKTANSFWYDNDGNYARPPFIENTPGAQATIDKTGYSNLILLANVLCNIGCADDALQMLNDIREGFPEDSNLVTAYDIAMAICHVKTGNPSAAGKIYEKYRYADFSANPDLACSMHSLATILLGHTDNISIPVPFISNDALTCLQYNKGLAYAEKGSYEEALKLFEGTGNRGLSMRLAILCELGRYHEAVLLLNDAALYYEHQLDNIRMHYSEETAYKHMQTLSYHIDLIQGAYCICSLNKQIGTNKAYEFLLNSKHISYDIARITADTEDVFMPNKLHSFNITEALDETTAILEICRYKTLKDYKYGMFLITSDSVDFFDINECSEIDKSINLWLELTEALARTKENDSLAINNYRNLNTSLRRLVFLPIRELLEGINNIYIAADGMFSAFPFELLSTSAGGILGDSFGIIYLNSSKELLPGRNSLLKYADKTNNCNSENERYENRHTGDELSVTCLTVGSPKYKNYSELTGALEEAKIVNNYIGGYLLTGEDANITNFATIILNEDGSPFIMHIATHGSFNVNNTEDQPWEQLYNALNKGGIILADDDIVSCNDIATVDLSNTALATLSCCDLGKNINSSMDGVFGMRRAFFLAGCRCLLVSLWKVDDIAAAILMDAFYYELSNNKTPSEALRLGKEYLKNYETDGIKTFSPPYYWAGYIIIGDRF